MPITHRVFPGATVDVRAYGRRLKDRFGLHEAVIVADRGMFSADNVAELAAAGQGYILALAGSSAGRGRARLGPGRAGATAAAARSRRRPGSGGR